LCSRNDVSNIGDVAHSGLLLPLTVAAGLTKIFLMDPMLGRSWAGAQWLHNTAGDELVRLFDDAA